jgi:multiple sugar transport system permease protein/raffinose/stachyose/melibiose transport system permease protein
MRRFNTKFAIFVFSFPALLLFTLFVVYPIIPELIISMQNNDGYKSLGFVGLANYISVLKSGSYWRSTWNTFYIVILSTVVTLPLSLLLALVIDRQAAWMKRFFKATIMFPAIISVTVIAQMWVAIYQPDWGLLNSVLRVAGLDSLATAWLSNKSTVVTCIAIAFLWQYIGLNAVIFYAGIQSIPKTYYEAALIDGAGFFRCSIQITIPLLQEIIKYLLVVSVLGCMAQFAHVKIMTSGGPGDLSQTVVYHLYYTAFSSSDFGQGCAIAVLFIIECLFITFLINRFIAKEKIEY